MSDKIDLTREEFARVTIRRTFLECPVHGEHDFVWNMQHYGRRDQFCGLCMWDKLEASGVHKMKCVEVVREK